jgi:stress response protein YsnF
VATRRRAIVVDANGVSGILRDIRARDPEKPVAVIELARGMIIEVPFELLEHHDDGGYSMAARWRDVIGADHSRVVPVIAERVVTKVREVPTQHVRVRRRVVEEEKVVETPIMRERIEVQRLPMDTLVERAPEPRWDGDTMIVPCVEEVIVIERRLRVREELRIRVIRERKVDRQTVVLRRHEVDVESDTSSNPTNRKK